jgi:hypothetical protein
MGGSARYLQDAVNEPAAVQLLPEVRLPAADLHESWALSTNDQGRTLAPASAAFC